MAIKICFPFKVSVFFLILFASSFGICSELRDIDSCLRGLNFNAIFDKEQYSLFVTDKDKLLVLTDHENLIVDPGTNNKFVFMLPGPSTTIWEVEQEPKMGRVLHAKRANFTASFGQTTPITTADALALIDQQIREKPKPYWASLGAAYRLEMLKVKVRENAALNSPEDKSKYREEVISRWVREYSQGTKGLESCKKLTGDNIKAYAQMIEADTEKNISALRPNFDHTIRYRPVLSSTVNKCGLLLQKYNQADAGPAPYGSQILQGIDFQKRQALILKILNGIRPRLEALKFDKDAAQEVEKEAVLRLIRNIRGELVAKDITIMENEGTTGNGLSHGFLTTDGNLTRKSLILDADFEAKYFNDPIYAEGLLLRELAALNVDAHLNQKFKAEEHLQLAESGAFLQAFYYSVFQPQSGHQDVQMLKNAYKNSTSDKKFRPEDKAAIQAALASKNRKEVFQAQGLDGARVFREELEARHGTAYAEYRNCIDKVKVLEGESRR